MRNALAYLVTVVAAFSALIMGTNYTIIDLVGILLIVGAVVSISVVDLIRARRAGQ